MRIRWLENKKTIFTRMCIGEAIIALLQDASLKQLKVLAIVRKAGVSRMTFYKYYSSPQNALEDYLQIIISEYIEESQCLGKRTAFLSYEHILFALNFFDHYREFFITMKAKGLYSILIDSVNKFVTEHIQTDEKVSVYRRYSYAGSLLNIFLMWEENKKEDSAEDVARAVYQFYSSSTQ